MATISSSRGLLALFKDEVPSVRAFALRKLVDVAEYFWHEIADDIREIQTLALDPAYADRELAAFLASQLHYQMENYSGSVS